MNFTKQGLALAIRPLFDEEDGNNQWKQLLTDTPTNITQIKH